MTYEVFTMSEQMAASLSGAGWRLVKRWRGGYLMESQPDRGPDPSHEAMRLFDPAPAPMPEQLDLGT